MVEALGEEGLYRKKAVGYQTAIGDCDLRLMIGGVAMYLWSYKSHFTNHTSQIALR
jgi:hypothetical protein